jgi:hypothetical protein
MPTKVSELVDLAEECFRRADRENSPTTADALRETGLAHLEQAYLTWQQRAASHAPVARA